MPYMNMSCLHQLGTFIRIVPIRVVLTVMLLSIFFVAQPRTVLATPTATPPPTCGTPDSTGMWTATDIGSAASLPGTTVVDGSRMFICGSGAQLWGTTDGLRFVYQQTTAQAVSLVARLDAFTEVQRYTKVGLSLRESTAAGARHVSVMVTRQDGVRVQWRAVTNGGSTDGGGSPTGAPILPTWLKLERSSGTTRAYYSTVATPTASDWVQVGSDAPFTLNNTLLAGAFVSSRETSQLADATFSGVSLNGQTTATPATSTATAAIPATATPATSTATATIPATAPPATSTATATPATSTATATPVGQLGHPRMFFSSAAEMQALRDKLANPQAASIWAPIRTLVNNQRTIDPPATAPTTQDPARMMYTDYRIYGDLLLSLAFACVITETDTDCDLAKEYMLTYAGWSNWERNDQRDLALSHMLMAHSLAYDWLYSRLTPAERSTIRTAIGFHAERMHEASVSSKSETWNNWWTDSYMQNHYMIDHAGMGMAGLVLKGEDSRAQKWIDRAVERLTRSNLLHNHIVDGSWHESTPYKDYFLSMQLPFLINLERIEGINMMPDPYLQQHIPWRIANHLPNSSHTILAHGDFGWDWLAGSEQLWVMRYVAARYQDGRGEWLAREWENDMGRFSNYWKTSWYVFEYIAFDPNLAPVAPSLARDGQAWHMQDLEAVIWRTGWNNDDLTFALKSGPNGGRNAFDNFVNRAYPCNTTCQLNVGHDHADGNTFYLAWGGTWLATEHEGEKHQATSYHNTMLIDNAGQYDFRDFQYYRSPSQYIGRDPFIEAVASTDHFDYVAGDATHAYKISGLEDYTRHVVFVRPGYFLILDNLESNTSRTYTWVSHFDKNATTSHSGNWIRATVNSNRELGVNVIQPSSFNHTFSNDGKPYVRISPTSAVQDTRFITLLYPTTNTGWSSRPGTSLQNDNGQMAVVRITASDSTYDDVLIGYRVSSSTTTGGYTFDGRGAVVSHTASGSISKLFVAHATQLSEGSTELVSGLLSGAQFEAAYTGNSVAVSGEFAGDVRLYAPTATSLTINGGAASFTREGDYIRFSR